MMYFNVFMLFCNYVVNLLMCRYALLCSREVLGDDVVECRVVALELLTCVYGVVHSVYRIPFLVDVEPALHALCPIFIDIASGVSVDPFAFREGCVESVLEFCVNFRIYRHDAELMDGMSELMDKDVLLPVTVAFKAEDILFRT